MKKSAPDNNCNFGDILAKELANNTVLETNSFFKDHSKRSKEISPYNLIEKDKWKDIDYEKFLKLLYRFLKEAGYQISNENLDKKPFNVVKP